MNDAREAFDEGDYAAAIGLFTYVLESKEYVLSNKSKAYALLMMGISYNFLKLYKRAIEPLNASILNAPSNYHAYLHRGMAFMRTEQESKAIQDLDKALVLNPESAMSYLQRGMVSFDTKDWGNSLLYFKKSIQLEPTLIHAYYFIGYYYYKKGKYKEAIENLNFAIQKLPLERDFFYLRGTVFEAWGGHENQAKWDFKKASDLGMKQEQ